MNALLSTAYWPNLHYFYYVLNAGQITIEHHENYQKQSYRNRTQILSANGLLDLSIPIVNTHDKQLTKNVRISYSDHWQTRHWRAITSAYRNSPYFEFFEDDLSEFYHREFEFLVDYNFHQLAVLFKILKLNKTVTATTDYEAAPVNCRDLREAIHPKKQVFAPEITALLTIPYYQTFENKFGFTPNLSVLDLLLNKGLDTVNYLKP